MKRESKPSVFKDIKEYVDFTRKHNVFGGEAIKLKKQLDKTQHLLIPKIKPPRS